MPEETCPIIKIKSPHPEHGGYLVINAVDFDPAVHEKLDESLPLPPAPLPPPPPSGAPDPLDGLAAGWREEHGARLKSLAQAVSGRAVENKEQAVAVIEAALAARDAK